MRHGRVVHIRRGLPRTHKMDLRGLPLRQVAELSKSWNFSEATLGVAALNAWHARHELLGPARSDLRRRRGQAEDQRAHEHEDGRVRALPVRA